MNKDDFLKQCLDEEKRFTFPSFCRNDVWELGCDLVAACREMPRPLAVTVWLGETEVFRYFPEGTGAFHEQWLNRKRNTVRVMERSSMRFKAELAVNESNLEQEGLDSRCYADCGGGFPIRIQGGCVIGFIGVSGMDDTSDHTALLNGIHRFFIRRGFLE